MLIWTYCPCPFSDSLASTRIISHLMPMAVDMVNERKTYRFLLLDQDVWAYPISCHWNNVKRILEMMINNIWVLLFLEDLVGWWQGTIFFRIGLVARCFSPISIIVEDKFLFSCWRALLWLSSELWHWIFGLRYSFMILAWCYM